MSSYNLGFIVDKNGKRLETNMSDIDYIVQFYLSNNFITNITPIYVEVDFSNESASEINTKLNNYSDIKVWITAVENEKLIQLNNAYFVLTANRNILLVSVCDEESSLFTQRNILHIGALREKFAVQSEKLIYNRMLNEPSYRTVYIFYDDAHSVHKDLFESQFNKDNSTYSLFTPIYTNINNFGEYSQTVAKLLNDVSSGTLTVDNTLFVYFTQSFETFFTVFNVVEDPILLGDLDVQSNIRHYNYFSSYLNSGYLNILALMKQNLVPKFINDSTDVFEFELFFTNKLRCSVMGQLLTRQQSQKYSYLNYVYYVRTPVDNDFLENHRITIYTSLIENAITLSKEILYREFPSLDQFYSSSIFTNGRMFGPFNFDIIGSQADLGYFNQIPMISYDLSNLYYIKVPKLMVRAGERPPRRGLISSGPSSLAGSFP